MSHFTLVLELLISSSEGVKRQSYAKASSFVEVNNLANRHTIRLKNAKGWSIALKVTDVVLTPTETGEQWKITARLYKSEQKGGQWRNCLRHHGFRKNL